MVFDDGHVLDWTVTALPEAERELDITVLLERDPIPVQVAGLAADHLDREIERTIWSFWWMTTVALKQCERGNTDRAITAVDHLRADAVRVWRLLHDPTRADLPGVHWLHPSNDAELVALMPRFGAVITPTECRRVLRETMTLVADLHPQVGARGVAVPYEAAAQSFRLHRSG